MKLKKKPIASLSLDLDNQWSYMKIHGDAGWEEFPSYLNLMVPRALTLLKNLDLTITFFIVGQDAALAKNQDAIASIAAAGHEIGNHSFHHESWLHLYSEAEIELEVERAEKHLLQVTGQQPIGFRGPGYSFSSAVLRVLAKRGYKYDASTFPTYLGPLARAYYFMTSNLSPEEREKRKALFGSFKEGFQPLKPYRWNMAVDQRSADPSDAAPGEVNPRVVDQLTEIPVTTMPIFKVPIHFSYVLFISVFSSTAALLYFRIALWLCKLTKTPPSLLLHPLDFLGAEDVPELAFFPGMSLPHRKKLAVLSKALKMLSNHFTVVPVGQHAELVSSTYNLPLVEPKVNPLRAKLSLPSQI
jgi:peptidoglycan-N-acetylglucosamine deacetylase